MLNFLRYAAVGVLVVGGAVGLGYCLFEGLAADVEHGRDDRPFIEYPAEINLGVREIGDLATARVTLANRGSRTLRIYNVSTNCSCTGLERQHGGEYVRLTDFTIGPDAAEQCVIRLSVRGVPVGAELRTAINFQTNDPKNPDGVINVVVPRVTGGVHTAPQSVVFGRVHVGTEVRQVIDVYDDAVVPREVARITSSDPDRVSVKLLNVEPAKRAEHQEKGRLIAKAEVSANTSRPGILAAWLSIHLKDQQRAPDSVEVVGAVVGPLELTPSIVTLPRRSTGGSIYETICVCRSTLEQRFAVEFQNIPKGVRIDASAGREFLSAHSFRVSIDPTMRPLSGQFKLVARFEDGQRIDVDVRVQVLTDGGSQ